MSDKQPASSADRSDDTVDSSPSFEPPIEVPPIKLPQQALRLNCPHCQNPIDVLVNSAKPIVCPSCSNTIRLDAEQTNAWLKVELSKPRRLPRTVGRFELLEEVGAGAFGVVWQARDTRLGRIVAIKFPKQERLDQDQVRRFLQEARTIAQLKHPHIVGIHEIGEENGSFYIVSDFIDGVSLDKYLRDQRPTYRHAAELCRKIAEALDFSHKAGIVHRDLKPSNIMLDRAGEPHVMDFGLAKQLTTDATMLTVEGQILGTPAYMSPEQARGEGHAVDRRADVYSLGVILFEMLAGRRPFEGEFSQLLHKVINADSPSPRSIDRAIPRDLDTISLKCLEKRPEKRYQTGGEVAEELQRYLSGEPILARRQSRARRIAVRTWNRHRRLCKLAIATFLVVCAFVAWRGYRHWDQGELVIKTWGGALNVALLGESDEEVLHELGLPMTRPVRLATGDYRLRVTTAGMPRDTYRVLVHRGKTMQYTLDSRQDSGARAIAQVGLNRYENYRLVNVGRKTGVLVWSPASIRLAGISPAGWSQTWLSGAVAPDFECDLIDSSEDFDGDGVRDFLFTASGVPSGTPGTFHSCVRALSGKDGQVLWATHPVSSGPVHVELRDIDADGIQDLIAVFNQRVAAVSIANSEELWTADLFDEWAKISNEKSIAEHLRRVAEPLNFTYHPNEKRPRSRMRHLPLLSQQVMPAGAHMQDFNGQPTLIVGLGEKLVGFDLATGKRAFEPIDTGSAIVSFRPWIDVDGDGEFEVLVEGLVEKSSIGSRADQPGEGPLPTTVYCARNFSAISTGKRKVLWSAIATPGGAIWRPEIDWRVADFSNDGGLDVLILNLNQKEARVFDGTTGQAMWEGKLNAAIPSDSGRLAILPDRDRDAIPDFAVAWLEFRSRHDEMWTTRRHYNHATHERDAQVVWHAYSGRDGSPLHSRAEMPIGSEGDSSDAVDTSWLEDTDRGDGALRLERAGSIYAVDLHVRHVAPIGVQGEPSSEEDERDALGSPPVLRRRDGVLYATTQPEAWRRLGDWWPAADFDQDGVMDLVSVPRIEETQASATTSRVAAVSGNDGRLLWQTTVEANRFLTDHKRLADLDGDQMLDLVVISHEGVADDKTLATVALSAISGRDGDVIWRRNVDVEMPADARQQDDSGRTLEINWDRAKFAACFGALRKGSPDELGILLDIRFLANDTEKFARTLLRLNRKNGRMASQHNLIVFESDNPQLRLGIGGNAPLILSTNNDSAGFRFNLSALDSSNGKVLWKNAVERKSPGGAAFDVADFNGDGVDEVVFVDSGVRVVDGESAATCWRNQAGDFFACLHGYKPTRLATREGIWDFSKGFDQAELLAVKWNPEVLVEGKTDENGERECFVFENDGPRLCCYRPHEELRWWNTALHPLTGSLLDKSLTYDEPSGQLCLELGNYGALDKVYCFDAATGRARWESDYSKQRLIESAKPNTPARTINGHAQGQTVARALTTGIPFKPARLESAIVRLKRAFPSARKLLGGADAASVSHDGGRIAYHSHAPSVWSLSSQTIAIAYLQSGTSETIQTKGRGPKWSPKGDAVVYSVGNYKDLKSTVWFYDMAKRDRRKLADGELPTWSHDGKTVYYVFRIQGKNQGEIRSLEVANRDAVPVTLLTRPAWDVVAAVSPDGRHVAFVEYKQDRAHLTIVHLGASSPVFEQQYELAGDVVLAWSPDSRRLALSLMDSRGSAKPVWLIDLETKKMLTLWNAPVSNVSWWTDSKQLVVGVRNDRASEVWLIDPGQRKWQPISREN